MIAFLHVICISLLIHNSYLKLTNDALKKFFLPALVSKIGSGMLLGGIYIFYFKEGDTLLFQQLASDFTNIIYKDFGTAIEIYFFNNYDPQFFPEVFNDRYNMGRTLLFSKLIALLNIVTGSSYWLNTLYLSLFSFWGSWKIVQVLSDMCRAHHVSACIAFLFFPSVIFWSSGLLKESIVTGALWYSVGLIIEYTYLNKRVCLRGLLLLVFCSLLVFSLKYFLFALAYTCFIAYAVVCVIIRAIGKTYPLYVQVVFLLVVLLLVACAATFIHPVLSPDYLLYAIVSYHDEVYQLTVKDLALPHLLVHYRSLTENLYCWLYNAPSAIFAGLFRPLVYESQHLFQYIVGVENALILLLVLYATPFVGTLKSYKSYPLLFLLVVCIYVITSAFLFGILSPNLGSLARYRVYYQPWLVLLLLICQPWMRKLEMISENYNKSL